ncbi:MAG: DUF4292 domain-containing protein [Bacteroidaceae bacterium]|nr:DUF4292 domain-containing protein [Bacteroidaceae bacterium]
MRIVRLMFMLVTAAVLTVSCRSSRHANRESDAVTGASAVHTPDISTAEPEHPETEPKGHSGNKLSKKDKKGRAESVKKRKTDVEALTAKLNLTLQSGSKNVKLGGNYRLKYNDVVQINLVFTLLVSVNVGTMELTRDYILILDRMNKRYCKAAYSDIPALSEAGIDFDTLQAIFWGDAAESKTKALTWTYDNWQPLGNGTFPGRIAFATGASAHQAVFSFSRLQAADGWPTRTEIPASYTPVSYDSVMSALMNVVK